MKQLAGLFVALAVTLLGRFGIEVPVDVQAALNEVLAFVIGGIATAIGYKGITVIQHRGESDAQGN